MEIRKETEKICDINERTRKSYLDSKAQKVIVTTVGQQALLHIINCNSANEWDKLNGIYEEKSESSNYFAQ